MERCYWRTWTRRWASALTMVLQVRFALAHPQYRLPYQNTSVSPTTLTSINELSETITYSNSSPQVRTSAWPTNPAPVLHRGPFIFVSQINDGQIQAPQFEAGAGEVTTSGALQSYAPPLGFQAADLTTEVSTSVIQSTVIQTVFSDGSTTSIVQTLELTSTITLQSTVVRVVTTTIPESALTTLTTSEIQSAPPPPEQLPSTYDAVTPGEAPEEPTTALPFPTQSITESTSLSLIDTSTLSMVRPTNSVKTVLYASNIFQPVETDPPPSQLRRVANHPVARLGIQPQKHKLPTNKFYANFYLGDQCSATFTHPYSVWWAKGQGDSESWGIAIAHVERSQVVFGAPSNITGAASFFVNPLGITSFALSAVELGSGTTLTTDTLEAFSVNVNLTPAGRSSPAITYPLVQGMGFVTAVYHSSTPLIQSGVGITRLTYSGAISNSSQVHKYRASLVDGTAWLIYITASLSNYSANSFTLINSQNLQGSQGFNGWIQVAKMPMNGTSDAESVYDRSAGVYATSVSISGAVQDSTGTYTFSRTKRGLTSKPLLMFALPHHMQSLSEATKDSVTDVQLVTTTKGMATAIQRDDWMLVEKDLPIAMGFAPWTPALGSVTNVSAQAAKAINDAALTELSENMSEQTCVDSAYYAGKALAKFASLIYAVYEIGGDIALALTGLEQLESNFALWVNNTQQYPFYYESAWGGTVSSASYSTGDSGTDFGNTYYNDHHFHYGYFVYAASVIAYFDPGWLDRGTNKAWVNNLVRDYANPIPNDPYYSFSRMFDWYHGHSWAEGLFESADGKNQESSSEDTMASYAIKMWGRIIGDTNMAARGNLMLAIQKRTLGNYYLYLDSNEIEPAEYIGNKAAGIVCFDRAPVTAGKHPLIRFQIFENKIDHTTYFGTNIEYIEGIHMLPQLPLSSFTRGRIFVRQEWETYFAEYIDQVQGGWRGILMGNYAIVDPVTSYQFFSNATGEFDKSYLDGGASQTWYLAWSAALGGSPGSTYGTNGKRSADWTKANEVGWEEAMLELEMEMDEQVDGAENGKSVSVPNDRTAYDEENGPEDEDDGATRRRLLRTSERSDKTPLDRSQASRRRRRRNRLATAK